MKSASLEKLALLNFWWRRGRVELPVQKKVARISYKLSQLLFFSSSFHLLTESS